VEPENARVCGHSNRCFGRGVARPTVLTMRAFTIGVVLAAVLAVAPAAPSTSSARIGQVAFVSELHAAEIYLANANGSGATRLTNSLVACRWPALSPDGSKFAYAAKKGGDWDVFVQTVGRSDAVDV